MTNHGFHSLDGGRCVAFNPNDDTMFLVGTDEGLIYKCTTEYSSKFLQTYPAHNTPIYNIAWNPYVSSIFLTCAAEWMIKIWDHNSTLVDLNFTDMGRLFDSYSLHSVET